jgi:predicted secreted protein
MPAGTGTLGRTIILKWNGAKIGGVREKSLAINGEPVDVTDDDSSGYRELLAEDGSKSIDIGVSGVTKSTVLRAAKLAGGAATIGAVTLEYPDGSILSLDCKLASYNETDPYQDAVTFEASLQSTGAYSYIPGP